LLSATHITTIHPSALHAKETTVNVKRILGLLVIALLIFFVITQPVAAANSLQNIGNILRHAAQSVTTFFTQLV
jgi:hypothetical protein